MRSAEQSDLGATRTSHDTTNTLSPTGAASSQALLLITLLISSVGCLSPTAEGMQCHEEGKSITPHPCGTARLSLACGNDHIPFLGQARVDVDVLSSVSSDTQP